MGVWQITAIVLWCIDLGINLAKDGQERKDRYSFGRALFNVFTTWFILCQGGFF